MTQDTNFDDLTEYFKKRIYGSHKGAIRLAVLDRDLKAQIPNYAQGGLSVLDIGAGFAQMGLKLAALGHDVCINDISQNMLAIAKQHAQEQGLTEHITWHHGAFQTLPSKSYDVVLCHAVLEWLDNPDELLSALSRFTHQNSIVSLMFYNKDALILHNLIRGNFKKIKNNDFKGMKGGLTPPNPLKPDEVEAKLHDLGFDVVYKSGIRVFSDYVGIKRGGNEDPDAVLAMELQYSNQLPYQHMGRYVHFVLSAQC
ncbi:MAG: methyltransferase domain-containing protein [Ghiorsea sp.]|nr:methyltransferase domain-containing protein [Ghiorsea sp.]